jgi:hypothetical protein
MFFLVDQEWEAPDIGQNPGSGLHTKRRLLVSSKPDDSTC